ncbi:carboxypeptidase-like regulatory domain-containing protein [Cellulophaga baltica 4]|nr:carboxypeptidase-like regulatory domain-containing protein [Cellulophaga baltica 4]
MKTKFRGILTLLLAFVVQQTFAQEKIISGTVSDNSGIPLPAASVVIKGSSSGTSTDFDGKYSLQVNIGDIVLFSYVGCTSSEVAVGAANTIDVTLAEDASLLDEVVVTGLGIKRDKKSIGYSQQSVSGEELQKGRQTDINNALAGRVSGVQVVGNSSSTFGNSEIKLRGETGALYVVDGVQVYSISDINMESVSDMSVLKGASATAIYGPDGRNGVIIITTKKGKSGKATFTIDQTTMVNRVTTLPDYQNEYGGGYSQTFNTFSYDPSVDPASWAGFDGDLYPDYYADESWGPKLEGQLVRHWDSWLEGTDYFGESREWSPTTSDVDDFYNTGVTSNTAFTFAKGGDDYDIRTSLSVIDQSGIIPNSSQKTVNASINVGYNISDKLSIQGVFNYQDRTTSNNPDETYGNLGSNMNQWWQRQLDLDRLKNYEQNGTVLSWNIGGPRDFGPLYWDSPYFQTNENLRNDDKNSAFGKIGITYKFNEKFTVLGEVRSTFNSYIGNDRGTTKSTVETPFL